jgi:hypothetical protein
VSCTTEQRFEIVLNKFVIIILYRDRVKILNNMSISDLVERILAATQGKDSFNNGAVGFNRFGFVFRDLKCSNLSYVKSIGSSKFCTLRFYRKFKGKKIFTDDEEYEILLGGNLKTLLPSLTFGGEELLYDVWVFVRTPDGRQFPAIFYYGQSGAALGSWRDYNNDDYKSLFTKEFKAFINYNPFQFSKDELSLLVNALENSLKKVPLSNYYGIYKHDTGNTLMGVRAGKPFFLELHGDPSKINIQKLINALLLP